MLAQAERRPATLGPLDVPPPPAATHPIAPAALQDVLTDLQGYRTISTLRSAVEVGASLVLYAATWLATWQLIPRSLPAAAVTALACGLLMGRLFVLFHDAVHRTLFKTPGANRFWGIVLGLLIFTPYDRWRSSHIAHHSAVGDLARSDEGYLRLHTLAEYQGWSRGRRLAYRIFRWPPILLGLLPLVHFAIGHRLPAAWRKVSSGPAWDVHLTTVGIVALHVGMGFLVGGPAELAKVQLPICTIAAMIPGWLFFVQHHFEGAVWKLSREDGWDYYEGALHGSSYLDLNRPLGEWALLGIGYHHIHHLDPRIPGYRLGRATRAMDERLGIRGFSFRETVPFARLALWDEEQKRLVPIP